MIEKIENIVDPEVRKEFELELPNSYQTSDQENKEKSIDVGTTEYEPDYSAKVIATNEREKVEENVEDSEKSLIVELTTVAPVEMTAQSEVIDVVEQIFNQSQDVKINELTTQDPLNFHFDFDPIVVVEKNELRSLPFDDTFTHKSDETTDSSVIVLEGEDEGFKSKNIDEVETKVEEKISEVTTSDKVEAKIENVEENADKKLSESSTILSETETTTTSLPVETSSENVIKAITEVVETRKEISVTFIVEEATSKPEIDDSHKSSSNSEKSSEESKSKEHKEEENKSSGESSEENNAKEVFDKDELRSIVVSENSNVLLDEDMQKFTSDHEISKKDKAIPLETERSLDESSATEAEEKTTIGIYATLEELSTTVSDGFKLTNELRSSVESFRDHFEENKIVLDTNNEIISSKNIKNSLVNIAEEMTLENHVAEAKNSVIALSIVAISSFAVIITLFMILKHQSTRFNFF